MVTDHLQNRVTGRKRSNEGDRKDALAWPPETLKAICQSSLWSSLQALQFVPQHHGQWPPSHCKFSTRDLFNAQVIYLHTLFQSFLSLSSST